MNTFVFVRHGRELFRNKRSIVIYVVSSGKQILIFHFVQSTLLMLQFQIESYARLRTENENVPSSERDSQWNSADRTCDFHLLYLKRSRIDSSRSEQGKTTRTRRSISVQIDKQASSILLSCRFVRISRLLIHPAGNLRPIQMCSYVNFIILFVGYRLRDSSVDRGSR